MRFEKWQALGNDYLIVERDDLPFELTPARIRRICEGHFGVFADGILLLTPSGSTDYVADLRIFNPDGSEAELSGNGAREAILYLRRRGWTDQDIFTIRTAAGEIRPQITGKNTCRVDMGHASLTSKDHPSGSADERGKGSVDGRGELTADGRVWRFQHVSIGNPQCAIHVETLEELRALDLPAIGPAIEGHELFPNRTNVSWYTELEPGEPDESGTPGERSRIRARIFERGVGETLSSGTGATGAAIAHVLRGRTAGGSGVGGERSGAGDAGTATGNPDPPHTVTVALDGGELNVEVGESLHVHLTGWAVPVFSGELSATFLEELHETE
ncbi:MAG TPA: diaminopimelate epimerase [Solirubrobacteraceae bacterium]|jgi:diaminopimelate epimerase|nr:diaminopimelate epimerase [Solirubrobacteraceae bacterium]